MLLSLGARVIGGAPVGSRGLGLGYFNLNFLPEPSLPTAGCQWTLPGYVRLMWLVSTCVCLVGLLSSELWLEAVLCVQWNWAWPDFSGSFGESSRYMLNTTKPTKLWETAWLRRHLSLEHFQGLMLKWHIKEVLEQWVDSAKPFDHQRNLGSDLSSTLS